MSQLTLKLRDLNPAMVQAWRWSFLRCEGVEVSGGDIFDERADAIVSPANSFGYMDGGIDLVYSQFFGWDLQTRLQELLRKEHHGELPVGSAVILPTRHAEIPWLVSAPSMRIPIHGGARHGECLAGLPRHAAGRAGAQRGEPRPAHSQPPLPRAVHGHGEDAARPSRPADAPRLGRGHAGRALASHDARADAPVPLRHD
jgi:hypothetical protein